MTVFDDPARRVVVTGMGCVTPLGLDAVSTWQAVVDGRSGVGPITHFDTSDYPVKIAAEVRGEPELGDVSPREARRMDRCIHFSLASAREALEDAALVWEGSAGAGAGGGVTKNKDFHPGFYYTHLRPHQTDSYLVCRLVG